MKNAIAVSKNENYNLFPKNKNSIIPQKDLFLLITDINALIYINKVKNSYTHLKFLLLKFLLFIISNAI